MQRGIAILIALGAAILAALPASGAHVRTFDANAPLTIDLPAGWKTVNADRGWRFKAVAPDRTALTFLSARPDTVDFRSYAASFIAFEKQATASLGPPVIFRTHSATVAGERAVLVYAAGRTITEYIYGFVHNGVNYVLAFATLDEHAEASKRIFDAAVRSVRFKHP